MADSGREEGPAEAGPKRVGGLVPFDLQPPVRVLMPRFTGRFLRESASERRARLERLREEEARQAAEALAAKRADGICHASVTYPHGWDDELTFECDLPLGHDGDHSQTQTWAD